MLQGVLMKIASAAQMAYIDEHTAQEWGINSALLMENAGRAAAYAIAERRPRDWRVIVLCGPGNNGGDGFCAARTLFNLGYRVVCLSSVLPEKYSAAAAEQRQAWLLAGGSIERLESLADILSAGDVVVDALFGTGLQRPVEGLYASAIEVLCNRKADVAAVDIPSGVSCDTGAVLGIAPQCALTVTMGLPKPGLFMYPGKKLAGERIVAEVGFARQLLQSVDLEGRLMTDSAAKQLLRSPQPWAHKGSRGCALVIGGSAWYYGAPLLAAEAVLRTGAGLCVWAAPEELVERRPFEHREIMVWPLMSRNGNLSAEAWPELVGAFKNRRGGISGRSLPQIKAVCIGPGLGRGKEADLLVNKLLRETDVPCVVDADALHAVVGSSLSPRCVLTPHIGEMAALLGCLAADVESDLIESVKRAAVQYNAVVVLKGTPTLICDGKHYWLNDAANPVLAQGGTGDVLAGVITSLLAQGYQPVEAACLGVYLHSQAGGKAARQLGPCGVLAGEIAGMLPSVYAELGQVADLEAARGSAVFSCLSYL